MFLNISSKKVNYGAAEFLDPKGVNCVNRRVKNMNTFILKFPCDAKDAFSNLKRKNANNDETAQQHWKN